MMYALQLAAILSRTYFTTGLATKELIIFIADIHIYTNHIDALKEQLKRRANK